MTCHVTRCTALLQHAKSIRTRSRRIAFFWTVPVSRARARVCVRACVRTACMSVRTHLGVSKEGGLVESGAPVVGGEPQAAGTLSLDSQTLNDGSRASPR